MGDHPAFPSRLSRSLYFLIYYQVPDGAFERAAETCRDEMLHVYGFNPDADILLMLPVVTEADFKRQWSEIARAAREESAKVVEGHLLTHASWLGTHSSGLEFTQDAKNDGTLVEREIGALEALNWHPSLGKLTLEGCNTGVSTLRGWCPAETFALAQGVTTQGQDGWAFCSSEKDRYVELQQSPGTSTILDPRVYLWAYNRGRNNPLGAGERRPPRRFVP